MTDSRPNPKPNPDTPFLGPAELSQLPALAMLSLRHPRAGRKQSVWIPLCRAPPAGWQETGRKRVSGFQSLDSRIPPEANCSGAHRGEPVRAGILRKCTLRPPSVKQPIA